MSITAGADELVFFDCNMRIGRAGIIRPEHFLTAAALLEEMDYHGISRALTYGVWSREWDVPGGNEQLLAELAGHDRLVPCVAALPPATGELPPPDEFVASVIARNGAVRIFPRSHQFMLSQWCLGSLLEALEEARVPLFVDMAETTWDELAAVLGAYRNLPIVLTNASYRINRYAYPLFERFANLHLEISMFQVMLGIEDVCRRFGPERLLFGTDMPIKDAAGPMALITYADISDEAKRLIAGENLRRLLGLCPCTEGSEG